MDYKTFFNGSHNPRDLFRSLSFDSHYCYEHPFAFHHSGIRIFAGSQGAGKTLSMIRHLKSVCKEYPGAIVCTNLQISGIENEIIKFESIDQFLELDNREFGIIFVWDEAQTIFNSLESRSISVEEVAALCQSRKSRRLILGTSQLASRLAKPFREQLSLLILCNSYLKYIQVNTVIDCQAGGYSGASDSSCEVEGAEVYKYWFFHSPEDYQAYNTLYKIAKIERGKKRVTASK